MDFSDISNYQTLYYCSVGIGHLVYRIYISIFSTHRNIEIVSIYELSNIVYISVSIGYRLDISRCLTHRNKKYRNIEMISWYRLFRYIELPFYDVPPGSWSPSSPGLPLFRLADAVLSEKLTFHFSTYGMVSNIEIVSIFDCLSIS